MSLALATPGPIEALDALARLYKAGGDALRLEILGALRQDSYGVLELCRILGVRQPALSHHLKVLAEAGLVGRRREGTSIFYHRSAAAALEPAARALLEAADAVTLREETLAGIARVRFERAENSRAFFAANAPKFLEQQELIAPPSQYQAAVTELLDTLQPVDTALELGPGQGWLLPALSARAARVLALDNSPEMLAQARAACEAQQLGNVELRLADGNALGELAGSIDLAVCNMVLHHTASPAAVLAQLALSLAPGGSLLLTDLCAHDQAWAREACGDLWLGFAPSDLAGWATLAGLVEHHNLYLALRNGFRVQLRVFQKLQEKEQP